MFLFATSKRMAITFILQYLVNVKISYEEEEELCSNAIGHYGLEHIHVKRHSIQIYTL